MRTRVALAVAVVVLLASAGPTAARRSTAVSRAVTIEGARFTPAMLTVKVGDIVVWTNRDPYPHTITSKASGFDSRDIAADKSWSYTFTKKGDFAYVCIYHDTMKATVRVE